jgi:hypothetical protein
MPVVDPLDDTVEDPHGTSLAGCATKSGFSAGQQAIQVELAIGE